MRPRREGYRIRPFVAVLLILLMLGSVLIPVWSVAAEDEKEDEKDPEDKEKEDPPEITIRDNPGKIGITIATEKKGSEEEFKFQVLTKNRLEVQLQFSHHEDDIDTKVDTKIKFKCLVGVKDKDAKGMVDCVHKDRAILKFSEMKFEEPDYEKMEKDGTTVHKIVVKTKDDRFHGTFESEFGSVRTEDGKRMPTPIEFDFYIKYFEFNEEDTNLVLVMSLEANSAMKVSQDPESKGVGRGEELGTSVLSYDDKASVDHEEVDVKVRVEDDVNEGTSTDINFLYPKGSKINHEIGLSIVPNVIVLKGEPILYAASIGAVAALFVLTDRKVLSRLRKKR